MRFFGLVLACLLAQFRPLKNVICMDWIFSCVVKSWIMKLYHASAFFSSVFVVRCPYLPCGAVHNVLIKSSSEVMSTCVISFIWTMVFKWSLLKSYSVVSLTNKLLYGVVWSVFTVLFVANVDQRFFLVHRCV